MGSAARSLSIMLAYLALSAGCVLFVSAPESGEHCMFRGEDTACGACLLAHCKAELNASCANESVLSAIEQCAATGDESCGKIPASDAGRCLASSCGAYCFTKVGTSHTYCEDSFFAPGLACECSTTPPLNDVACSSTVYTRTRCCAPVGWPAPALLCRCNAVACVPTSDGCACTLTDNLDATTETECSGPHCCAVEDRCQCRQRGCEGAERPVPSCNRDALLCPNGTTEQPACSIRQ